MFLFFDIFAKVFNVEAEPCKDKADNSVYSRQESQRLRERHVQRQAVGTAGSECSSRHH